jgi:hypothetical protein
LIINSILAISEKSIFNKSNNTKNDILDVIKNYIPIYNIFLRYKAHNFDNPNKTLKESIILRGVFSILILLFSNINTILIILFIVIIRIVTITNGIYV